MEYKSIKRSGMGNNPCIACNVKGNSASTEVNITDERQIKTKNNFCFMTGL